MTFRLTENFIDNYRHRKPPFGFNGLGELVYRRTYSRLKPSGSKEQWWETVRRVVEGTYNIQKEHIDRYGLGWNGHQAQRSAQEMYDRMWNMKFLPPGRGLWAMGSEIITERKLYAALNNCAFVSTVDIKDDFAKPFCFLMDMSMLGVGVGFDTKGAGLVTLKSPQGERVLLEIDDSRSGWVRALGALLESYTKGSKPVEFDFSGIRSAGEPIKGFGGTASGPEPLRTGLEEIRKRLDEYVGKEIDSRFIVDVMNLIGRIVVSGNVRRSAEIALGDANDEDFIRLKDYEKNPDRSSYGWASNNSIVVTGTMDSYERLRDFVCENGEPGIFWLDNARSFGRMGEVRSDSRVMGQNPCVTGDTKLLTDRGYFRIDSLVDKTVNIWGGVEWAQVKPRVTGRNQHILNLEFSDGSKLSCTPYHEFFIVGQPERVAAKDLQVNDKLIKFDMPVIKDGEELASAYTQGFFAGDGQENKHTKGALLYGEKKTLLKVLDCRSTGKEISNGRIWASFPNISKEKFFVPINFSLDSKLEWLGGLLDADGCVLNNPNSNSLQISSVNLEFLENIRLMLTTLGCQPKISKSLPAQMKKLPDSLGGYKQYPCKDLYVLSINATDTKSLVNIGLRCFRLKVNKMTPQRNARRFVYVKRISEGDLADKVYCFTNNKSHTGTFNGIVTGQCGEQSLESYELCCLVETFPARHESIEDFLRTLKYAYLYAKTVTLGQTHWPETNRVLLRNRRIGCSVSGVQQFCANRGIAELKNWLSNGYTTIQQWDEVYSGWFCIPRSVKTTSVKPSGTVSLLAGATPGIHWPESRFYIRRIRLSKMSELLPGLRKAGYPVEDDVADSSAVVVEFPVDVGEGVRPVSEITLWQQLELVAFMQQHWSDNQVSCTVSFDPEREGKDIGPALELYQYRLKSVSFLPRKPGGAYKQSPYEAINEAEYRKRLASIDSKVSFGKLYEEAEPEKFCDGATCTL